jgi:hypothetical protein
MAINPNNGVLDIINGTLKVSSIDIKQAAGFTTALNTVARNDVLLFDDQKATTVFTPTSEGGYMSSTGVTRDTTGGAGYIDLNDGWVYWPLQLPNSWHTEFDMHVTTTGGVLTYSLFNTSEPNHTDYTNNDGGYKIVFDNTNNQIDIYWEGSIHKTVGANLRSSDWQHVNINYFQGAISVSLAGKVVLTHEFTQNYQEFNSRYVGFSATAGASHKIRHLRVHNSDKWLYTKTSNASDITYVSGNVGIGTLTPTELLDVHGNVHVAKDLTVNGNLTVSGTTTFIDTQNLAIEDPIIEVAKGNASDTIDAGLVITRATSNVAVAYRGDEEELALGYTQSGASDTDVTPITDGGLDVRVYGNLFANNLTTTANVDASYINGNVVTSNLTVSGNYTMGGHIIPDTNDAYDIGSAEKKIRDIYVSDNSLWVGDETKISFSEGKMRFRKRKMDVVPAAILTAGGTSAGAKSFAGKTDLNDIKIHEWLKYMKTLSGKSNAKMGDVFRDNKDDYEVTTAAEAWKDMNDEIYTTSNVSVGKTTSPTVRLDVEGDGKFSGNVVTTGNIGISKTTPDANLHVVGYQYVNDPPTLANAFDHSDAPLTLTHGTPTSTTAIDDPKAVLHLTRDGTSGESYGARASFNLSRYENSGTASRSRLDVALTDGTYAETNVMSIRADGRVGIGTTTPGYTLDVNGDINLSGDFYQGGSPFVSSLWTDGTDSLYYRSNVEVGTANLFVDTMTGNVGVGTNSPGFSLDVHGTANVGALTATSISGPLSGNADTATALETARTIGGVSFDGSGNIDLPGVNTTGNQNTSGNAATATALETARTIGGVSFDGTANIDLPGVNTTGNQNTSGNAATATALETARTIGGVSFDGTANIDLPGVNTSGNQDTTGNADTATTATNQSGGTVNATTGAFSGNVTLSGGKLIASSSVTTDSTSGIMWHSSGYSITRTSGAWSSPNYQQLLIKWNTGMILDVAGGTYGRSYVGVNDRMAIGSSYYNSHTKPPDNGLLVQGNVGIGTMSPDEKLDINGGNIKLSVGNSYGTDRYIYTHWEDSLNDHQIGLEFDYYTGNGGTGTTHSRINFISNATRNTVINGTGKQTMMSVLSNGRVGIGTKSPKSKLDVYQGSNRAFGGRSATLADSPGLTLSSSGAKWGLFINTNNDLIFVGKSGATGSYVGVAGFVYSGNRDNLMNFTGQHRTFIKDVPFTQVENLEGLIVSADNNKYIKMSGGIEVGSNAITTNESLPMVSLSTITNDKKCFGVISQSEDPEKREDKFGNFVTPYQKELGDTRVYINSVGEGAMWVTDINGPLESGDYITTSNVAGYGQKQNSEFLANYTVAKITMDCDFTPLTQPKKIIKKELANVDYWIDYATSEIKQEEYETLPENERDIREDKYYKIYKREIQKTNPEDDKFVYEVHEELVNVLDEHGQLQWEDDPSGATEKAYKIRYLDTDGNITDEANAVHIAAFVGCTYHCG